MDRGKRATFDNVNQVGNQEKAGLLNLGQRIVYGKMRRKWGGKRRKEITSVTSVKEKKPKQYRERRLSLLNSCVIQRVGWGPSQSRMTSLTPNFSRPDVNCHVDFQPQRLDLRRIGAGLVVVGAGLVVVVGGHRGARHRRRWCHRGRGSCYLGGVVGRNGVGCVGGSGRTDAAGTDQS